MNEFWKSVSKAQGAGLPTQEDFNRMLEAMRRPPERPFVVVPKWVYDAARRAESERLRRKED